MLQARELFERMSQRYQALSSYSDRGVILRHHRHSERPNERFFRTWFRRPHSIRLDWRDHHPYEPLRHLITNFSVCANGTTITYWKDRPEELQAETEIGLAFAGAATLDVPNLLLPSEIGSFRFEDLQNIHVRGSEEVYGTRCYQILGEHPIGGEYQVWIAELDYLLRRVRTDYRYSEEENDVYSGATDYMYRDIQVDGPIDASVFWASGSLLDAG